MLTLRTLTLGSLLLRMLLSIVVGGVIGIERGMKNRPAGLRTYILVCLGSCVVMMTNQYAYQVYQVGDPVRMGAQVVSGIGFLGAGMIIVTAHNRVRGLTTAAGLWATACIGLALGIGLYETALLGGVLIFIIFTLLHRWDAYVRRNAHILHLYVELDKNVALGEFLCQAKARQIEIDRVQLERDGVAAGEILPYLMAVHRTHEHEVLLEQVRALPGVHYVEELT